MKRNIIVDIDGTVADLTHRRKYVDGTLGKKKDWPSFHAGMTHDTPHADIIALVQHFASVRQGRGYAHKITFVTGRHEAYRNATLSWLSAHVPLPNSFAMYMRIDGDYRSDDIVKEEIYLKALHPLGVTPETTAFVLDDRDRVVHMWRRHGFRVLQVAPGDF
jgi:FMN phosphatase YigB (HAD superfamily)